METKIGFRVEIDKEVEDIINWFTQNYSKEISGWMVGTIDKDLIKVTKLLIPHQEVGGASVDTNCSALVKLRKEYGDECLKIIGHFHSHNTMTNFWSTTDEVFISQYMETREKALFLVSSKSNGHRIRLELRNPVKLSIDDIEYSVSGNEIDILGEELKKVIEEKVTECKVVANNGTYPNNYGVDELIYSSDSVSLRKEKENYEIGLSNEEINKMINFYNKNNRVVIKNLTSYQYGRLEDLGEHDAYVLNNKWEMDFKVKNKEEAIRIMKEAREELKIAGDYDIERELEDLGYT